MANFIIQNYTYPKINAQIKAFWAKMFKFLLISGKYSPVLTLTKNFKLNFVFYTVLKMFENNADVSTFIFQDAVRPSGTRLP
jgi:hypothetical protein